MLPFDEIYERIKQRTAYMYFNAELLGRIVDMIEIGMTDEEIDVWLDGELKDETISQMSLNGDN